MRPSSGTANALGHSIADPAAYLPRVGALIEAPSSHPTQSGRRNLKVLARPGRLDRSRIAEILEAVELSGRGNDLVPPGERPALRRVGNGFRDILRRGVVSGRDHTDYL